MGVISRSSRATFRNGDDGGVVEEEAVAAAIDEDVDDEKKGLRGCSKSGDEPRVLDYFLRAASMD